MEKQALDMKNTKEVTVLVLKAGKVFKEAKENDGKIDYNDVGLLLQLIPLIGPAVDDINKVPAEFKDMSVEELAELLALIANDLGAVVDEKLKLQVEKALKLVHAAYDFAKTF